MRFQCPECKGIVAVENADMGSVVQCGHCGMAVTVPESRVAPGSVIGDFVIRQELGRGGMGIVYEAHQISLDRSAAVKILSENYAKNADFVVGFIREARAAAKLNHPNIVQAYAVGEDEGIFYFAMEHINGYTMKDILQEHQVIPWDESLGIILQIAEALDYAWQEEKLVHRDIKPDNIMLTSNGRAKLADLGLAKVGDEVDGSTDSEEVMGTPQYISPEQLTGAPLDCRTDIYSLGATFYHFLTGRFPYTGASAVEISRQHLEGTLIPVNEVNPEVPQSVALVVAKMMEKDPAARYQNAGELSEDLTLIKRGGMPVVMSGSNEVPNQGTPSPNQVGNNGGVKAKRPRLSLAKEEPAPAAPQVPQGTAQAAQNVPPPAPPAAAPQVKKKPLLVKPAMPEKTEPAPSSVPPPPPAEKPAENAKTPPASPVAARKKTSKKENDSAPQRTKTVLLLIVILVIGAAGAAAFLFFNGNLGGVVQKLKEVPAGTFVALEGEKKKAPPSEYMVKGSVLAEEVRKTSGGNEALVRKCKEFLLSGLTPVAEEEKALEKVIVEYFVAADEDKLENARLEAIRLREEESVRKAAEAMENARKKQLAEAARREALLRRQAAEAARREEARKAEQERNAKLAVVNRHKGLASYYERRIYTELNAYSEKNDVEGYKKLLQQNLEKLSEFPREFQHLTRTAVGKTRAMLRSLEGAWQWNELMTNSQDEVKGLTLVIGFDLCTVTHIKDGVVYGKTVSGNVLQYPINKHLNHKSFRKFIVDVGYKNKKLGSLPFYFFWRNEPVMASSVLRECSPREQSIYRSFVISYLREALKGRYRGKLIRKFGPTNEYKALFPPARPKPRPAVRKAPAKKAPAKKAPAKKAPAKKKK